MSSEFARGDGFQLARLRDIVTRHVPLDRRTLAVDAGAHVGSWTVEMGSWFEHVIALEPEPVAFLCLERNTRDRGVSHRTTLLRVAAGDADGIGTLGIDARWEANSGGVYVVPVAAGTGEAPVVIRRLDDIARPGRIDFLKLDVEGSEAAALRGAAGILSSDRPIVMCELKERLLSRHGTSAVEVRMFLSGLGYSEIGAYGADVVFAFTKEG